MTLIHLDNLIEFCLACEGVEISYCDKDPLAYDLSIKLTQEIRFILISTSPILLYA